jgi:protein TonB
MGAVCVLHGLLLAAAWFAREALPRHEDESLTAVTLSASALPRAEPAPPTPVRLVASTPTITVDPVVAIEIPAVVAAPTPSLVSIPAHGAGGSTGSTATQTLDAELEVQCPDRAPPRYPLLAKRQHEQGEVRLRVELDESGRITDVAIVGSSGSPRLDDAARAAIESWHCRPAQREGQPVRAVAMQSLAFLLERR